MEINTYQVGKAANPFRGFVEIDGRFKPVAAAAGMSFHYLQVVTTDDRPPGFSDGTGITVPYVDPPPGGYQGQAFDLLPYYDPAGKPFPGFFDKPTINLAFTKNQPDLQRELDFETWLVCVIKEDFGRDPTKASDDTFTVAPLLGWKWGFDQTYADVAPIGTDDLGDITQTIEPFAFLNAPSANWIAGLGRVYGAAPNTDRFNIVVGDCKDCLRERRAVPEGGSSITLLFVLSVVGLEAKRRRK